LKQPLSYVAALLIGSFAGAGCHRSTTTAHARAQDSAVSQDVDALTRLLNLPSKPSQVWWQETPVGASGGLGPTDHDLHAVLRFDKGVGDGLGLAAPSLPSDPARLSLAADLPWLPPPVRAAISRFDDHSIAVRGRKFDAAPLLKPPFGTGAFIVIDGGEYVFLSARTS
jgi:hypothetical protein